MNSVDRFKKRKKIIGSISVYESVDKELVNEFLNSEVDKSKVETSFKIVDEHYDFKYDFTVSKDEAKEFLEQFKKDFNQERFDKLIIDCRKEVINSIVTPFGLGKILSVYDKVGGNITTTQNFEKGIVSTLEDKNFIRTSYDLIIGSRGSGDHLVVAATTARVKTAAIVASSR